jgi:protein phosphatase
VVNVGDSRLYALADGELKQITHDHSYVQYLVDMGQITMKEAKTASIRNIIIRSVGNEAETTPDLFSLSLQEGAYLLLCSDGLTNCVANDVLAATVHAEDLDSLNRCAETLITLANEGGGIDNITVVLAKI